MSGQVSKQASKIFSSSYGLGPNMMTLPFFSGCYLVLLVEAWWSLDFTSGNNVLPLIYLEWTPENFVNIKAY